MTNHVHLLVTPGAPGAASALLQDLGRRYVRVVNKIHGRTGTLWEGRFKSNLVDSERYLLTCHRYIELNPVRAGVVTDPTNYPWSSHIHYSSGRPSALISEHQVYLRLGPDPESRRKAFLSLFDESIDESDLKRMRIALNKGWAIGSKQFVDQMEAMAGAGVRPARRRRPKPDFDGKTDQADTQPDWLL